MRSMRTAFLMGAAALFLATGTAQRPFSLAR
jgi:hypothetical protein